jgi:tetratricopeptide (TPR) repeat protein
MRTADLHSMAKTPKISLCMIAKNEADWLAQCIKSVSPIICETILVDTGSTDDTIKIAESLGAKVFVRPWDDDFSAPRNLSLEKASGDWILVLDADEAIAERDLKELQNLTKKKKTCYEFMQRHYSNDVRISAYKPASGEYPEWERNYGGYFESGLCRLFPNHQGIEYIGRVHELVEHSIRKLGKHKIVHSRIPIHHYGHTEEVKKKKNKGKLYTPLGTAKLGDDPSYWQAWFELGVEHNNNGRLNESVEAFTKALKLNPTYVQSWVNIGYVLCELGKYQEAMSSLQTAIKIDPVCYEAYCNLGVVHLRIGQHVAAEKCFRIAIKFFPEYVNAFCNLGKALAFQRRFAEAANIFIRALELLPQCTNAKIDLGVLYFGAGIFGEAEKYFISALKDNPNQPKVHYFLAQVFRGVSDATRVVNELKEACRLSKENPGAESEQIFAQASRELAQLG